MERIPVSSSSIASVGYDSATRVMEIEFTGGAVYQYFDVPSEEYDSFLASDSKGKFFNSQIKGRYQYTQL